VGAAQQNVGTTTNTHRCCAGHADVFSGERARGNASGWRKHKPTQHAARAEADADTHGVKRAVITLRWALPGARLIDASHRLVADEDEPDVRINVAVKRADLSPRCRLSPHFGRCRKHGRQGERGKEQTMAFHDGHTPRYWIIHSTSHKPQCEVALWC